MDLIICPAPFPHLSRLATSLPPSIWNVQMVFIEERSWSTWSRLHTRLLRSAGKSKAYSFPPLPLFTRAAGNGTLAYESLDTHRRQSPISCYQGHYTLAVLHIMEFPGNMGQDDSSGKPKLTWAPGSGLAGGWGWRVGWNHNMPRVDLVVRVEGVA